LRKPKQSANMSMTNPADNKISEDIKQLYADAEKLGEDGKIDESVRLINKAEELKKQRATDQANQLLTTIPPINDGIALNASNTQQQKLRICDICGAYLSVFDSDRRLADHFGGKLHIGYLAIREKLREIKDSKKDRQHDFRLDRERSDFARGDRERYDRDRDRERDRSRNYSEREKESKERDKGRDDERYKGKYRRDKPREPSSRDREERDYKRKY